MNAPQPEPHPLEADEFSEAFADLRALLNLPPRWDL